MYFRELMLVLLAVPLLFSQYNAQTLDKAVSLKEKNLGGPRMGITVIHGRGELSRRMKANNMDRLVSQFGWHFEYQVSPEENIGPSFVIQFVPLFGGVEYGKFIPSLTTAFGIRFPKGFEFGMGPNITVSENELKEAEINSSLILALGVSLEYSGVSIPLNLAYSISPYGNRASFVFGYAL
jgi:hypothetical protein